MLRNGHGLTALHCKGSGKAVSVTAGGVSAAAGFFANGEGQLECCLLV
jgi:hypothetical protein